VIIDLFQIFYYKTTKKTFLSQTTQQGHYILEFNASCKVSQLKKIENDINK
jgi:hypothetical protein